MPTTRAAAGPDRQQRLENAALRNRVKKSYEKAQQEEALRAAPVDWSQRW
jgi:hypothetical protein